MSINAGASWIRLGYLALTLVACGGGDDPTTAPAATVGAAGGTVTGTGGAQVVVSPGALAQTTTIAVAQTGAGAPALPAGVTSFGPIFAFTPFETSFAVPVTVTVPFDPATVPAGTTPVLYRTNAAQTAWEPVAGATVNGGSMTAQVTGLSYFTVGGVPPLMTPTVLDASFGSGGKVTTAFGGNDTGMALQGDGKIVMAGGSTGDFVLARYNSDGSLDTGFGGDGLVTTDVVPGGIVQEVARAVAVQADGKIVVVGYTRVGAGPFAFALTRYDSDGILDASFGSGGKVVDGVAGRAFAVAIQPGGKLVVAGDDTETEDFKLARYNADGILDTSFGGGGTGTLTTDITGDADVARNIVLQPSGAIVVSGDPFGPGSGTGVARYSADGILDPDFGVGGTVTLGGAVVGEGLALQDDGKLVLVGRVQVGNATQFAVMRRLADGAPDTTFGDLGTVRTAFTTQQDAAQAVTLGRDGKILVSGRAGLGGNRFALARYNPDGTLDTGFAAGGKTTIIFFFLDASAENVAVQPDGKIVLGGFALDNVDGYALARINP